MYIVVKSLHPQSDRLDLGISSGAATHQLCNFGELINLFGPQFPLL